MHYIMALPESGLRIGWAPSYASFQSFVTAMRLLEGDAATADWLRRTQATATSYAGELGVVLGVERGEVDVGFAPLLHPSPEVGPPGRKGSARLHPR